MANAEKRLYSAWRAGFFPFAMLFRDEKGGTNGEWSKFQRSWVLPQIVHHKLKNVRREWA
jgi:hypothetical protein